MLDFITHLNGWGGLSEDLVAPCAGAETKKNAATGFARANRVCDVFVVDGATAVGYL
jgi:hypothetical protein